MVPFPRSAFWLLLSTTCLACATQTGSENAEAAGGSSSINLFPSSSGATSGNPNLAEGTAFGFSRSANGTCQLTVNDMPCSTEMYETENIPLDIYVMFDRSGSMCSCVDPPLSGNPCPDPNCRKTRIEAIREAMANFMSDSGSNGIGLGAGYFGQQPLGAADCRPETYSIPDVAIADLPNNSAHVMTSLNGASPVGETPTGGAIRGACRYAREWKGEHPEREVVLLFLTDGEPKAPVSCPDGSGACCPTLPDATQAASDCVTGNPSIKTYVLGVGPFLENLTQIAEAGGSNRAYLVEGGDVAAQVLAALNQIRGDAAIPCEFKLPSSEPGNSLDLNKINIAYTNTSCNGRVYHPVASAAACGANGGWYWDDPSRPSAVKLCPSSCSEVSAPGGKLGFAVGCQTVSPIY